MTPLEQAEICVNKLQFLIGNENYLPFNKPVFKILIAPLDSKKQEVFHFNYRQSSWDENAVKPEENEDCIIIIQFIGGSLNDMNFLTVLEFIEANQNKIKELHPVLRKDLLECLHH